MDNKTTQTVDSAVHQFEAAVDDRGGKVKGQAWQTPDGVWNASIVSWFHATGKTMDEAIGNVVRDYVDAH